MDFTSDSSNLKSLLKKMNTGPVKLAEAKQALSGNEFSYLTKKQINQLKTAKSTGGSASITFSASQLKKMKSLGSSFPHATTRGAPRKIRGGVAVAAVASGALEVAKTIGLIEPVKQLVASLVGELEYMIVNPAAGEFKQIYVRRLPDLGLKYNRFQNDIDFLQRKEKPTKIIANKINAIMRKQADIAAIAQKLLMQLPILKEIAEKKDAQLAAKEAAKRNDEINKLEAKLATLQGEGMQVDPPSRGYGLQVDPPSSRRGRKKKVLL